MFKAISLSLLLFLAAGTVTEILGQSVTSSTLLGNVTDSSGAAVVGATVRATEVNTGVSRSVQTDQAGNYTVPYLTPGLYRVEVEGSGFKKLLRGDIELLVGAPLRVDAALEPGSVNETVEVTAESPMLKTDRADVSQSFSTKQVRELPIANRNYQALAGLLPGVTPPSVDFTQLEDPQGTTFFRANGQGNSANNTLVDGADNINPTLGLTIYIPPAEAVQEVSVTTSNYSAEYGRAGGAIVNVATRGGTNELHGSLFIFHRDASLRARNVFNTAPQR
nr:carboxypeptidase regulatory-like domain-containing protein [Pyrinomonadaceae bacterium]